MVTVLAELLVVVLALGLAAALRPWRTLGPGGPPWPWLAWLLVLPVLWAADRLVAVPLVQPWSGVCLLVLMAGWPLAMLALLPVAALAAWLAGLDTAEALHRLMWLGVVPGTLALGFGLLLRRWLPHHLFIYILGRGFAGTLLCTAAAGMLSACLFGGAPGLGLPELLVGRWLAAWGDAWLCGIVAAIAVAFRPHWLATYTDRLYLPPRPKP